LINHGRTIYTILSNYFYFGGLYLETNLNLLRIKFNPIIPIILVYKYNVEKFFKNNIIVFGSSDIFKGTRIKF